jgi:hypothetical protein
VRTFHHRSIVAAVSVAAFLAANAAPVAGGPTGSYTFNYAGTAPAGTIDRITAKTADGKVVDIPLNISGLTKEQATSNLLGQLGANGTANGTNSINIVGGASALKQVDGGTNTKGFEVFLDGTVNTIEIKPGEKFAATFAPGQDPLQGITSAGSLAIDIAGVGSLSTSLAVGTTPGQAATAFYNLLLSDGFVDVQAPIATADGIAVSFYLSPTNSSLGGSAISRINSFEFDGANLHYGLLLPQSVPEPTTFVMSGMAAVAGLAYWWRRRRSVDGPGRRPGARQTFK